MAVKAVDKRVFESILDGLAKATKEKPEDILWFFQVRELMSEMERPMSDERAWKIILGDKKTSSLSTSELLELARKELKKFHRIERKLKKLGVI
jgi:predicted transcriptional regulator